MILYIFYILILLDNVIRQGYGGCGAGEISAGPAPGRGRRFDATARIPGPERQVGSLFNICTADGGNPPTVSGTGLSFPPCAEMVHTWSGANHVSMTRAMFPSGRGNRLHAGEGSAEPVRCLAWQGQQELERRMVQ